MKSSNIFKLIGVTNHAKGEREINDYYATDSIAGHLLLEVEPELNNIWECACGEGHLAKVFEDVGKLSKQLPKISTNYLLNMPTIELLKQALKKGLNLIQALNQ